MANIKRNVSIGICVKNSERTIRDAVISLTNQSFDKERMDVIVVDDGCTDKTIPLLEHILSKAKVSFGVLLTHGAGLTAARQMVIDSANGEFVIFMDGDMVFPEDFIQRQVEFMENNSFVGVAQGTMVGRKSRGPVAELEDLSSSAAFEIGVHRNLKRDPPYLGTGGSIFRVNAVKSVGGFDKQIKGAAEDAELTTKIKSKGYLLAMTDAQFEHEFKRNLKGLWKQYSWYGYGMHYVHHKHGGIRDSMLVYFWPVAYAWSIVRAILIFRATRNKIAFFLPSYSFFRATAWWFGFLSAHLKHYGH